MSNNDRLVTRRDFIKIAGAFGLTAAIGGLLAACGSPTVQNVTEETKKAAEKEKAKGTAAEYKLVYGLDGAMKRWPDGPVTEQSLFLLGTWELKQAIEKASNGRVVVEIHEGGELGVQADAAKKVQQGILDMASCSTQNVAAIAPVWNVTDIPYAIGGVDNYWKIVYSKEVNDVLREKSKQLGIIPLVIFPQSRWLELRKGLKEVRKPEDLAGLKMRVTGSKLEQEAFKILPANPTPIAWGELYTAMNEGAVDGAHVGTASIVDANIHEALGQIVNTEWMYNADTQFISTKNFNKFPPDIQEAILEAAFEAQVFVQNHFDELFIKQVGNRPDSPSDVGYKKAGVNIISLTEQEKAAWVDFLSYERNKDRFDPLIDQYGRKEYETVVSVASSGGSPEQKRWWK